ncbi:nitroreductase [Kordiimonas aestuarii]|uniref:nitroreductase n=1 Tax=Kordiimonas aestuarii TaxID=1005925 RepID=UPI0021D0A6C1|nr:nitroreductase [Kordiimonas aestuarii]
MADDINHQAGMDVRTALASRRSVRDYRSDALPEALVDDILTDALHAPSWGNVQPYRVAVASGDVARAISADYLSRYEGGMRFRAASPLGKLRQWLAGFRGPDGDHNTIMTYPDELNERYRETGKGLYGVLGIGREDKAARVRQMGRNFTFFGAPTALFIFASDELGAYGPLDAGAFIQSLALAAHARGLGSCAQAALATWASPVRARFNVPPGYKLICGMALGYASDAPVNAYAPTRRTAEGVKLPSRT